DRIALEVRPVRVARRPDRQVGEQPREVLVARLEEALEHRERERLPEAPRPGYEDRLRAPVEQLADEVRLVDVGEPLLAEHAEVADTDRDAQGHGQRTVALAPKRRKRTAPQEDRATWMTMGLVDAALVGRVSDHDLSAGVTYAYMVGHQAMEGVAL